MEPESAIDPELEEPPVVEDPVSASVPIPVPLLSSDEVVAVQVVDVELPESVESEDSDFGAAVVGCAEVSSLGGASELPVDEAAESPSCSGGADPQPGSIIANTRKSEGEAKQRMTRTHRKRAEARRTPEFDGREARHESERWGRWVEAHAHLVDPGLTPLQVFQTAAPLRDAGA